jgi:hypothetical protein
MISKYPWASDGDVLMGLQGWSLGVSFGRYISGSESKDIALALAQVLCMVEYEAISNRMDLELY